MDAVLTIILIVVVYFYFRYRRNVTKSPEEIKKEKLLNYALLISVMVFTMALVAFTNRGSLNVREHLSRSREDNGVSGGPRYLPEEEQMLVILVNQHRSREGLTSLTLDPELGNLARLKAREMVELDYLGHESPAYGTAGDMVISAGYTYYTRVGENFIRATGTAREALDMMKNQEEQYRNLQSRDFTHLGAGVVEVNRPLLSPYRVYVLFLARHGGG